MQTEPPDGKQELVVFILNVAAFWATLGGLLWIVARLN